MFKKKWVALIFCSFAFTAIQANANNVQKVDASQGMDAAIKKLEIPAQTQDSKGAPVTEIIDVDVTLPPNYNEQIRYPVLYINDGQDMQAVHLQTRLKQFYQRPDSQPIIVVAIHMFKDRMATYGFSDRQTAQAIVAPTKYGDVGRNANLYATWVIQQLVPYIDQHFSTQANAQGRVILGWSLGAVSAFDIGGQYPEKFSRVGMFSPSLWLSLKSETPQVVEETRIAQNRINQCADNKNIPAIYLAIGTNEDTDDRDKDGVNDALDDVMDFENGWHDKKGLRNLGVSSEVVVLVGGKHQQPAWSEMLPRFLRWAFAKKP